MARKPSEKPATSAYTLKMPPELYARVKIAAAELSVSRGRFVSVGELMVEYIAAGLDAHDAGKSTTAQ